MATIKIKEDSFEYEEIELSYATNIPLNQEIAKELLLMVKSVFDENNLPFFLAFGTLLGAIRDDNFIKGDEDIDVGIKDEEKLISIIPELYKKDVRLCRVLKSGVYSFMYKQGCYIDVYIARPFKFSLFALWCVNFAGYATPRSFFKEREFIDFLGEKFPSPKNPIKILRFWYGETWNIPVSGHSYTYEIRLAFLYKKIRRWLAKSVKFIIAYDLWSKNV